MAEPAEEITLEDLVYKPQTPTRLQTSDLLMKNWIFPRLVEIWPHKQRFTLQSWLGQITGMNEFCVRQTTNAVAVFERIRDKHADAPVVREWFVLVKDKSDKNHQQEGLDLYDAASKWAWDCGAKDMDICINSDVSKAMLTEHFGKLESRPRTILKVVR